MGDVLPDYSAPHISLEVNGLSYYYVMTKDENEDVVVYIRNEDAVNGGYIFEEVDDWSGLPGNSIFRYFTFPEVNADRWGNGEIYVNGNGVISDPSVIYFYKMDIGEQAVICTNPLVSPECPGYLDALYDYLKDLEDLSADDPYYDEWVQIQLEREAELDEDETNIDINEEKNSQEEFEERLRVDPEVGGLVDVLIQEATLFELSGQPTIISYYDVTIYGGEYQESLTLTDTLLPDNNRALRDLASDGTHRTMVRSQYDREQ